MSDYNLPFSGDQTAEYLAKARDFSGVPLDDGLYAGSKTFTAYDQYVNDTGALFKLNPSVALGYAINVPLYPDAKNDPNLIPYSNFESASTEAIDEFNDVTVPQAISNFEDDAAQAIRNAGGVPLGDGQWGAGKTYTAYNEYLVFNGVPYKPLNVPYTTQGADPTQLPDLGSVQPFSNISREEIGSLSGVIFSTLADVNSEVSTGGAITLSIGDNINVLDYATGNNSGTLFFRVVAAGTGVHDGGQYIDLPAPGLQLKQNFKLPVSVKAYGAKGGGADDSVPFQMAINRSEEAICIPYDTYLLKNVNMRDNQEIISYGATITPLDNTSTAIVCNLKSDWAITGYITFKGHRLATSDHVDTGEVGLHFTGARGGKMENAIFKSFKGTGLVRDAGLVGYFGDQAQFSNIMLKDNILGAYHGQQFDSFSNLNVVGNDMGFISYGGNLNWHGGSVTDNIDGFKIVEGGNNAHGILVGVHIAHNLNRNIWIDKTLLGFTFLGCHLAGNAAGAPEGERGIIQITNSGGINFIGGRYACFVENTNDGTGGTNYFKNVHTGGYQEFNVYDPSPSGVALGGRAIDVSITGTTGQLLNGTLGSINEVAPLYFGVQRLKTEPQAIVSYDVMTWPDVIIHGDIKNKTPAMTPGIYEVGEYGGSLFKIEVDTVIRGTTLTSALIEIHVDGQIVNLQYGIDSGSAAGKEGRRFNFAITVYSNTDIKMKAIASGTDLEHAGGPYDSSLNITLLNK